MDQTRFNTLQMGIQVASELTMDTRMRQRKGEQFTLTLVVPIPFLSGGVEKTLDIIVDRIHPGSEVIVYKFPNGDLVIETDARLTPEGEVFKISVMFKLGQTHTTGACVHVSQDMERLIMKGFENQLNHFLEDVT